MENLSPQQRKEMEESADQLASLPGLDRLVALSRQNALRWRGESRGQTKQPRKIEKLPELEENFHRANLRLTVALWDERDFLDEVEQMRSTHFPEDPLDGEPGA